MESWCADERSLESLAFPRCIRTSIEYDDEFRDEYVGMLVTSRRNILKEIAQMKYYTTTYDSSQSSSSVIECDSCEEYSDVEYCSDVHETLQHEEDQSSTEKTDSHEVAEVDHDEALQDPWRRKFAYI